MWQERLVKTARPDSSKEPTKLNETMEIGAELLLHAYCQGIFPMADSQTGDIGWYRPDPRAIIPLDAVHVSKNLRRLVKQNAS